MLDLSELSSIRISLASPDTIREWSKGEVKKPETINYRTLKPEREGLFCEKIFGPTKDWECNCGKYKRVKYKGVVCDRCGVEVTRSKVRRERMGHIELAAPVSHIWYFKGIPSRMGLMLDLSPKLLEKVLYFAAYIVLDPGNTKLAKKQILSETEFRDAEEEYGAGSFRAKMGAEAMRELLSEIDLDRLAAELRGDIAHGSGQKSARAMRRLEVVEAFRQSGNRPEWMILDVVPVIPPDLRPMVQLDGGRFATCDLNDLYRRVINRNNRLKRLLELNAPEIIVRNEKRMLQEAVDALIDNGRRGRPVAGPGNRPLKSLSDMLKGKQGRFRQNLLGKRVDYSGRSVIVVGPELRLYQCGLPKEMALELFKPFVMRELVRSGMANNIKSAKRMVERVRDEVWDILEEVIKDHPVLLNRAPTLHRLGIQAFEPVLVEGRAIQIHPLVCTAYNADFDGDQMAVHVPLSSEAQAEARLLMLSAYNLLNPKDGKPVVTPTKDMVLGCYYLTTINREAKGSGMVFVNKEEALMAYELREVAINAAIKVRLFDKDGVSAIIETTVGRLIFNEAIPQDLGFVDRSDPAKRLIPEINRLCDRKVLGQIVERCYKKHGTTETTNVLDSIKSLGFEYATRSGISIGMSDIVIPEAKKEIISSSETRVRQIAQAYAMGQLSDEERYSGVVQVWQKANSDVQHALEKAMPEFNPVYMMANSGARGNMAQINQLGGMRGLMSDPSGRILELPVKANFREGLTVLEYFTSTHGARKGSADTAIKTADSGYLTRRLVDVSQDVIIREEDCGTDEGLWLGAVMDGRQEIVPLSERITGRYAAADVTPEDYRDPVTGQTVSGGGAVLVKAGMLISDKDAAKVASFGAVFAPIAGTMRRDGDALVFTGENGNEVKRYLPVRDVEFLVPDGSAAKEGQQVTRGIITRVKVRTVLTCQSRVGVCAHCYGINLANGASVDVGEAIGIIAAQSIGEPGTQLTMRTFHMGGVAGEDITQGLPRVEELFEARHPKGHAVIAPFGGIVKVSVTPKGRQITIEADNGETISLPVNYTSRLKVTDGNRVDRGQPLTEGSIDPHELLGVSGIDAVEGYLLAEVQKVYRQQGVEISDKHIEVIVRQMLRKLRVMEAGDTTLLPGSLVDTFEFETANEQALAKGATPAVAHSNLLGVTKAALATDSFLSAASFQETTRVLTDAAIKGKTDNLIGLKENVIIGKLIPAGTGLRMYRNLRLAVGNSTDADVDTGTIEPYNT